MRAACSVHPVSLDVMAVITFGEEYKLRSFPLRSPVHHPVTSSRLVEICPELRAMLSDSLSLCSSRNVRDDFTPTTSTVMRTEVFTAVKSSMWVLCVITPCDFRPENGDSCLLPVSLSVVTPEKTEGKIVALFFLNVTFLHRYWKTENSELHGSKHSSNLVFSYLVRE